MSDGLSSTQLRAVADKLRARYSPPDATMTPGKYVSHEVMTEFAHALLEIADEQEPHGDEA